MPSAAASEPGAVCRIARHGFRSSVPPVAGTQKPTIPAPDVRDGVHCSEDASSHPQHEHVERRPENNQLPTHGAQRSRQVVRRRQCRRKHHRPLHLHLVEQLKRLDYNSCTTRLGDEKNRIERPLRLVSPHALRQEPCLLVAVGGVGQIGKPTPESVPPLENFNRSAASFTAARTYAVTPSRKRRVLRPSPSATSTSPPKAPASPSANGGARRATGRERRPVHAS